MPSGTCLCGSFQYTVEGSFGDVRYCHCSLCRRANGTAFSANAKIDNSQWVLEGPQGDVTEFEHKPGMFKAFCSRCGSPLYARSSRDPDDIRVRFGGFQGSPDLRITGHGPRLDIIEGRVVHDRRLDPVLSRSHHTVTPKRSET
jgi:hypothetical protein